MRTPILNLTVSLTLIIAIGAVLFALGAPAAIGTFFAALFSWEMPYIAAITSIIGETCSAFGTYIAAIIALMSEAWSAFGIAYPAFLAAEFTWQPDVLMASFTSASAFGIAAGYIAAPITVGVFLITATLLMVAVIQAAFAFLVSGPAGLRVYAQILSRKAEAVGLS